MDSLNLPRRPARVVPACPSCAFQLEEVPPRGSYRCRCGQSLEVAVFRPPTRAHASTQAVAPGISPCARHARNAAVATCEHCGAFMCALCRIEGEGLAVCAACFEEMSAAGTLPMARVSFRNYNGLTLQLALLGLFLPVLAVAIGPLAVLTAWKGRRQGRELGETFGARGATVGAVLGVLETFGGFVFWLAVFGAFK